MTARIDTCTAEFHRLASQVGGIKCSGSPVVTFTNPLHLDNWTMPVIEATLVVGAIASLVHAVRWKRSHDDVSNLVVWCSGVLCLLLVEPIAYFPQWFGLEQKLGLTFVHNQFSVQFLENRLPLYIVAMYPVFGYVSYVLVQRTGVLQRHNPVIGAACVAFTFHVLYEIIDMVGPQLRWWVWNTKLATSTPHLGVVPYINIQAFSIGIPFGIALLTQFVARQRGQSAVRIVGDVVRVSVGTWPVMFITSIPSAVISLAGASVETGRLIGTWFLIALVGVVTAWAITDARHARRHGELELPEGIETARFALTCTAVYLVVAAVIWIGALPTYLDAHRGLTRAGNPIGSFPYAVVVTLFSIALLVATHRRISTSPTEPTSLVADPELITT